MGHGQPQGPPSPSISLGGKRPVQRHLYPVLLLCAVALAAAVCLRPSLAEELMTLAGRPGRDNLPWPGAGDPTPPPGNGFAAMPGSGRQPVAWAPPQAGPGADAMGEAFVSDEPQDSRPRAPRHPSYDGVPNAPGWPSRQATDERPPQPVLDRPPVLTPFEYGHADPARAQNPLRNPPPGRTPGFPPFDRPGHGPGQGPETRSPLRHEARRGARSPVADEPTPCEGAQILAKVGSDVVLASEVTAAANEILAQNKDRIPPGQLDAQRELLIQKLLEQRIEIKAIYQDAKRQVPPEGLANIEQRLAEQFESVEVPKRMERAKAASRRELEEKFRKLGTSLEREKRSFIERTLAQQWIGEQIKSDKDATHDEILAYYQDHVADFEKPARARWEQLTVRVPRYTDGSEAYARLAEMGNQLMRGTPMADVLKAQRGGAVECGGGPRDWITKDSLDISRTVEEAVFGLPVGRLSRIFRDGDAFYIVRVLEREEMKRTPFEEAQVEIRKKIGQLHRRSQLAAYTARVKEQIPVWTIFDDPPDQQARGFSDRFPR